MMNLGIIIIYRINSLHLAKGFQMIDATIIGMQCIYIALYVLIQRSRYILICAHCGTIKENRYNERRVISHGICATCYIRELNSL